MAKTKAKYVTTEKLSRILGVYPEIIAETLSYFDPMVNMVYEYDLTELIPAIEDYIEKAQEKKPLPTKKNLVTQKILDQYSSLGDFIYKKMTIGGLLDPNTELNDKDLKILKKLITEEQLKRKK